jgi:hypothetical protein
MIDTLKQSYKEQLIKAGVEPQKAVKAAEKITREELNLIGEIWTDWANAARRIELSSRAVGLAEMTQ